MSGWKLYRKVRRPDGRREIYIGGIKVMAYRCKKTAYVAPQIEVQGKNNRLVGVGPHRSGLHVKIYGDNNTVEVLTEQHFGGCINIGEPDSPASGCTVRIGENTGSNGVNIRLMEDGSSVVIGRDCMFAHAVYIWCSDTHSLLDAEGHLLNVGRSIEIGDHCWVGMHSYILKNTRLAAHSVVGLGSVVTSCFDEPYCVLAGVPARVVKRGVHWDLRRPQQWLNEHASADQIGDEV